MSLCFTRIEKGKGKKKLKETQKRGNSNGRVIAGSRIGFSNGAWLGIVNPFELEFNHCENSELIDKDRGGLKEDSLVSFPSQSHHHSTTQIKQLFLRLPPAGSASGVQT